MVIITKSPWVPDPPILAVLAKSEDPPKKTRIFLSAESSKSLEKKAQTHKKARRPKETAKRKKWAKRKKQGLEGQGICMPNMIGRPGCQGPPNGGFQTGGGFPIWTCPSFFVLFGTFPIFLGFSRFARGWSGDFPDLSFSSFSAY